MNDLLYGLMLKSGNDCAVQIAETVGGNVENFANLMNKKAEKLGLKNTHFVTPHGLDANEHYTTAYELALLTTYALDNPKFSEIVNTKTYTINKNGCQMTIGNTNELLGYLEGVNGVKTGFTNNAGRCLVTSVSRDNFNIICVVLGADTKKIRTTDSIKLIEYTYSNYEKLNIKELAQKEFSNWKNDIKIYKGTEDEAELKLEELEYKYFPINKIDIKDIKTEINTIKTLEAPVKENKIVGNMLIKIDDKELVKLNIITKEKIERKSIFNYLLEIVGYVKDLKV